MQDDLFIIWRQIDAEFPDLQVAPNAVPWDRNGPEPRSPAGRPGLGKAHFAPNHRVIWRIPAKSIFLIAKV
jgi:hypothetical protein